MTISSPSDSTTRGQRWVDCVADTFGPSATCGIAGGVAAACASTADSPPPTAPDMNMTTAAQIPTPRIDRLDIIVVAPGGQYSGEETPPPLPGGTVNPSTRTACPQLPDISRTRFVS